MSREAFEAFNSLHIVKVDDYKNQRVSLIQQKLDGQRLIIKIGNSITASSKNDKLDYTELLNRLEWFKSLGGLPQGTVLDCELIADGTHASSVRSGIIEGWDTLKMYILGMPYFNYEDQRFESAEDHAASIVSARISSSLNQEHILVPNARVAPDYNTPIDGEFLSLLLKEAASKNYEGWVAKNGAYHSWYRIKPVRTVDCYVVKANTSDSINFFGGLKNVIVAVKDKNGKDRVIASVGGGFTKDFRMTCKPSELVGRVCVVQFQSVAAKGMLQFPQFVNWRADKDIEACTEDQLE